MNIPKAIWIDSFTLVTISLDPPMWGFFFNTKHVKRLSLDVHSNIGNVVESKVIYAKIFDIFCEVY